MRLFFTLPTGGCQEGGPGGRGEGWFQAPSRERCLSLGCEDTLKKKIVVSVAAKATPCFTCRKQETKPRV